MEARLYEGEASKAINRFNGCSLNECQLNLNVARPREERS